MKKTATKNNKKKIFLISFVTVFIVATVVSLFLFLPRDFSNYFTKSEVAQIQFNDEVTLESKNLDVEEIEIFFDEFKNARYVPNYFPKKVKSSFHFKVTCDNGDVIILTPTTISKNNKGKNINVINVELYDVYLNLK